MGRVYTLGFARRIYRGKMLFPYKNVHIKQFRRPYMDTYCQLVLGSGDVSDDWRLYILNQF